VRFKKEKEKEKINLKALALFAALFLSFIFLPQLSYAWLEGWEYRRPITIDNTQNSNTLTDYQVLITLNTQTLISQGKMRNDCGDIRFVDSDETTLLNYWIESDCNSANTKIWVKVPNIPASSNKTIYVYYGNPDATSLSNGDATFEFFDDFETNPNSNGKWIIYRETNDATNECFWDSTNKLFYLTKAVGGKGCMAFFQNQINYPFLVSFKFKIGGGNGADGLAFAFDKDIQPYITYGKAKGGSHLGLWAYDGTNNYISDGYAIELDSIDNGANDPSGNYIAVARTNSFNGGFPRPGGNHYNTSAVEDNQWHTIEAAITSNSVVYVKLDGTSILTNIAISNLGYQRAGFGAGTGGSNNNHIIDDVLIRKYTSPEPTTSVGSEEITSVTITIYSPQNTTYYRYSITYNFTASTQNDPKQGLVGHWKFNEGSGTTTYDYSNYGNDGTLYDGNTTNEDGNTPPQWVDGKYGKALYFDGVDDHVETPILQITDKFTISAWVYFISDQRGWGGVICNLNGKSNLNRLLLKSNSIQLQLSINGSTITHTVSVSDLRNAWHHYAVTYNGSVVKIFFDGKEVYNATQTGTLDSGTVNTTIGWGSVFSTYYHLKGIIDEVRIYNRALSEKEIEYLYQLESPRYLNVTAFLNGEVIYQDIVLSDSETVFTSKTESAGTKNLTIIADDFSDSYQGIVTQIFTIKNFDFTSVYYNSSAYETSEQNYTVSYRYNKEFYDDYNNTLIYNETPSDYVSYYSEIEDEFGWLANFSQIYYPPLIEQNNTQFSFKFQVCLKANYGTWDCYNSSDYQQNVLFGYQPSFSLENVVVYNNTLYSNSTTFVFTLNNLTISRVNVRIRANESLIKDDSLLTYTFTPETDSYYYFNFSISFGDNERYFGNTDIYYLYTIIMNHDLNITFGFWTTIPQQSFNFSVYSPYAPYVNCSLLNLYNYTYYRYNMSVWYKYNFPINQSPIRLDFVCRDFFNTNSSVYEYPIYIIQIKPIDEEVGVYNTSLWLDPTTNKTAIIRFVAISPFFNQSLISENLSSTVWLIVPTNTWILTVQTLYSLQYFTQTYVLRDWTKYEMPVCIPENKPQNLQTAYSPVPIDWSFIIRRGDTGCVKTIDKATNSLGNYFGFYFYTLPGIYTVSKLENGTEIFISPLRGESENLIDLQKIIYQWQQVARKIATIARISILNILNGNNSTIVYVTTNIPDNYKLEVEKDGSVIYSQVFPDSQNFSVELLWRYIGINADDILKFKLYGSEGLIYQITSSATGKIYKYSALFTGTILVVMLIITFLKPINIEKIFILSLITLFVAFYLIPQTHPSTYINMLGFGIIILVVSSGLILWKTMR